MQGGRRERERWGEIGNPSSAEVTCIGTGERVVEQRSSFSPDYISARQRFIDAAEQAGTTITTLPLSTRGPYDERLSVDIAYHGAAMPRRLLLHTSGTHGVEGFPGSAVQLELLNALHAPGIDLPDDTGLLLVHAVNPWGFAWLRRVNEDNTDLNRNFLPPGDSYDGEPKRYHEVDRLLNPPTHLTPLDLFLPKALWTILRMGFNTAKQTIAEGQYERPKAMQFGGAALCEAPRLLLDHLAAVLEPVQRCVFIDLHTGLGPFGVDSLLVSAEQDEAGLAALITRYGPRIQPLDAQAGVAYRIRGGMQAGIAARWPDIDWTPITQEFGTVKPLAVLKSLRAENRMTQWSGLSEQERQYSVERRRLVEVFSPPSEKWRTMILERGRALIDDGLADLLAT